MKLPRMFRARAWRGVLLGLMGAIAGCKSAGERYVAPEGPLPPNTVMLSQMMRELADRPGFTEALLAQLNAGGKKGPALLTPTLVDELRRMILGKDWQGLDRFPGWTMRAINPTVRVGERVVGKDEKAEGLAAVHPGAPAGTAGASPIFLDLGLYGLDKGGTVSLDEASTLPPFTPDGIVSEIGDGVTRGDGANDLAAEHAESSRLADLLNRLSLNGVGGYAPVSVTVGGRGAKTPEELVQALTASGHSVVVADARYFANFGHFHYKGQDVMMPFWVNSQILIPETTRPLLIPVSHAEYEWRVRGPKVNADVSWYFGVDGKAEFRTMDTLDQSWVMGRHAHEYQGADAAEVTRLAGKMVVAYVHQHVARPELPFGGYYALGVCQDSVAAIEMKMTGKTTLFPNTADVALFNDARDAEVNKLIAAIPKDRSGRPPEPERVFGSLPVADAELGKISIPGLGSDLIAVRMAWREGNLRRAYGSRHWTRVWLEALGAVLAGVVVMAILPRRRGRKS